MKAADREGLQKVEALSYLPSWQTLLEIWSELDLPCVQQASYLERGLLMWMFPLYLHVNQKSDDDDDDTANIFLCGNKKNILSISLLSEAMIKMLT